MKEFWIVWNPDYPMPPRKRWASKEQALQCAKEMAEKNGGSEFFVLQATHLCKYQPRPVVQVNALEAADE